VISPMRLLARTAGAWDEFFFAPQDLRTCALIRMGYAALVLIWLAVLWPDLSRWYAADGLLPAHAAERIAPPGSWSLLQHLPPGPAWLYGAWLLATAHGAMLLVGFGSRLNAAAVFVWIVSFCHRNEVILDSEDSVMRLVGFYLVLMPCGGRWSLDALLRRRHTPRAALVGGIPSVPAARSAAWGLRLLQIQMCIIFLSAGLSKLFSPQWQDGTAMYYVARLTDYFGRFPTPDFFWETPWVVRLITWSVIAAELAIPLLIWWKPARLWALAAVLLFHLANEYTMHLFLFHWIMLVGWASFLTGDDLDAIKRFVGWPSQAG
jgi:uncharacterized membrane protein YphA (DoxX/SURF4 family)